MRRLMLLLLFALAAAGCSDALAQAVPPSSGGATLTSLPALVKVGAVGDSITQGNFTLVYYPDGMHSRQTVAWNYLFQNFAVPGQSAQTIASNTGSNLGAWPNASTFGYIAVLAGINDLNLNGRTAVQIEGDLQTIYDWARVTNGSKLILFTIMPFHSASSWSAGKETIRTTVNAWITGTYAAAHPTDTCVSDSSSYMSNSPTDATYLLPSYEYNAGTDGIHVNQAGQDRLGQGLASCLP